MKLFYKVKHYYDNEYEEIKIKYLDSSKLMEYMDFIILWRKERVDYIGSSIVELHPNFVNIDVSTLDYNGIQELIESIRCKVLGIDNAI